MMREAWKVVCKGSGCVFPEGITRTERGVHFSVAMPAEQVSLVLYQPEEKEAEAVIPFPVEDKIGDLWSLSLEGDGLCGMEYEYEVDNERIPDPCGRRYHGWECWGDRKRAGKAARSVIWFDTFDWENDRPLEIPFHEMLLYKSHVRGLTRHESSNVEHKGTFLGIIEKIPYLKELGVTGLELMPCIEFDEIMLQEAQSRQYAMKKADGRINYWGFVPGYYFSPKTAFCSGKEKNPEAEMKMLVKTLHQNGIELIIDLFFTGEERQSLVLEILRFWVREYHVDGIHLVGFVPEGLVARDACLSKTKLFYSQWNAEGSGKVKHLAAYNDGFQNAMRRFLKGDEEQINPLVHYSRTNPPNCAVINYMANNNGFTMMDMVSYDQKHNEENGENNQDGEVYNYSWNCGVEGPTKKKKVKELRNRQLRNAFTILLLSQGTPLILAGDEFGNTKKGNNNSYCQDNSCSWVDWKLLETNRELYEFVKTMIAFRKKHPVFHMPKEPKVMDYLSCGCPDVSYHGVKAWCPEFENFRRQLGIMYCGEYAKKEDGASDDYFFVAYNMHWEPHEFALPNLPKNLKWHIAIDTSEKEHNAIYPEGSELLIKKQKQVMVPSRSIMVFISKEVEKEEKAAGKEDEKKKKTGKTKKSRVKDKKE